MMHDCVVTIEHCHIGVYHDRMTHADLRAAQRILAGQWVKCTMRKASALVRREWTNAVPGIVSHGAL